MSQPIESIAQEVDFRASSERRRRPDSETPIQRLPPHSIEAEQGILGCIFLSPNDCIAEAVTAFKEPGTEVFYDLRHQTIFTTMVEMWDKRDVIDLITVQQRLKDNKVLDQVGGIQYLCALSDTVPSAANLGYYLGIVLDKYVTRRAITIATDVIRQVYEYEGEVDTLMDQIEHDMLSIRHFCGKNDGRSMGEAVKKAMQTIEDFHQRLGSVLGLPTGFRDLDTLIGGLAGGDVFVLAARPSMGKTSLAMNIVEHVAVEQQLSVGVFSFEMTMDALVLRMLCSRARVNYRNVRDGFLAERDFPKLTNTAGKLAKAPIHIEDICGLSIMQLRARARRMAQRYGIKLLVIDYLQLLKAFHGRKRIENRQQEVAEISHGVKELAKELNIPIILLAQLSRELERDKNRKPRMSDLRESGDIEADADVIGLLYKVPNDKGDDADLDVVPTNLLIAKQRNGPAGVDVKLNFLKCYTRFEDSAKIEPDHTDGQSSMNYRPPATD